MASIPDGFMDSLRRFYNYTVLQEVKESVYFYNESSISREIRNYLFAVNFEAGRTERCVYKRIREDVSMLLRNLRKNYGYSDQGAREVCLYVIDNDLARAFAS
jgi:hypothetical protein